MKFDVEEIKTLKLEEDEILIIKLPPGLTPQKASDWSSKLADQLSEKRINAWIVNHGMEFMKLKVAALKYHIDERRKKNGTKKKAKV